MSAEIARRFYVGFEMIDNVWKFDNGITVSKSMASAPWTPTDPKNLTTTCAVMLHAPLYNSNFQYADIACSTSAAYICEWD
jgi:hypothetical protein